MRTLKKTKLKSEKIEKKADIEKLINDFIKKADENPNSITNKNCDSGKCISWDINPNNIFLKNNKSKNKDE